MNLKISISIFLFFVLQIFSIPQSLCKESNIYQTHLIHSSLKSFLKEQNYPSSKECSGNVEMERRFLKKGFHRDLETSFQLIKYPDGKPSSCKFGYWLLVEEFPPEVFLDRYQLGELERLHLVNHHVITAEMDLEKPAYHPNITFSYVGIVFSQASGQNNTWNFSIPVHFRYQKPSNQELFSEFCLHKPDLFFTCFEKEELISRVIEKKRWFQVCISASKGKSIKDLDLTARIPVGSLQHSTLVSFLTLGITSLAAFFLVYILYCYHPGKNHKE